MRTSKESVGLLTGSIRGLSAAMRNVGIAMTAASAVGGVALLTLSRRAERVNEKFREIGTITSDVANVQAEYSDLVSNLNTQMGLQGDKLDILEALYQSISAGVDEAESSQREFLGTASKLAVVGRVDLATAVDVISTSMNAYGKGTEFAQRSSEALFRTVQFGKVTLDELAPVMGRITALGSDLGVNIEELGAAMSVLTRTGFEARVAATGVRAVLRQLMKPSETMKRVLREIAVEQDFFADQMERGGDLARRLADDYRTATSAIREQEDAIDDAKKAHEEASLAIQEARLMQMAIEQDRVSEVKDLVREEIAAADSTEELEEKINSYRLEQQKARLEEDKAKQTKAELEEEVENVVARFEEELDAAGNLNEGIGLLVGDNLGLIETLEQVNEKANEQNISMAKLIPRTRGLQAALALLGDDGKALRDIFDTMRKDGVEAAKDEIDELAQTSGDFSQEEAENLKSDLKDLDDLYADATGPAQEFRNSISRIKQSFSDLGQIFVGETFSLFADIAGLFERVGKWARSLDESVRKNIARFATLSVAIGLVLGPLLLFGGQIALIATAMGTAFLPFLAVAGTLAGVFAAGLQDAMSEGDEATDLFAAMGDVLSTVIGFVSHLKTLFVENVLPGLVDAGNGFLSLISEISDQMSGFMNEEDISPLEQISVLLGEAFSAIGNFLSQNKELIASLLVLAVDVIINDVAPAVIALAQAAFDLAESFFDLATTDEAKTLIAGLGAALLFTIGVVSDAIRFFASFVSKHDDLIAKAAVAAGAIAGVLFVVGTLATVVSGIIGTVQTFAMAFAVASQMIGPAAVILSLFKTAVMAIIPGLGILTKGVSVLMGAAKLLAAVLMKALVPAITAVAAILGLPVWAVVALIAIIGVLIATAWHFRDEITNAISDAVSFVVDKLGGLMQSFFDLEILALQAGQQIIEGLAQGILNGVSAVADAASVAASTVAQFLPSSPAERGPLADKPPEDAGMATATDFAKGLKEGVPQVEEGFGSFDPKQFNVESKAGLQPSMPSKTELPSRPTKEKKVFKVEEGAVTIEAGAFQGVSDEELPEKVREEVDESMEDILERLESKGTEVN